MQIPFFKNKRASLCALLAVLGLVFTMAVSVRSFAADEVSACPGDSDCDGLSDTAEAALKTDLANPDTDGDGIKDGEEGMQNADDVAAPDVCDPRKADTDGDGLADNDEIRIGTHCNLCDSDSDGLSDGIETGKIQPKDENGCHGLMPAGTNFKKPFVLLPLNPDSDADGLTDGEEDSNGNGWLDPDESDPTIEDTDKDGLGDYVEATGDFDGDGVADFDVGLISAGQKCSPPENISDTDCDGMPNAVDVDSDNDSCADSQEGGWLDQNSNGIPDVYDSQAKACPEDVVSSSGSSKPAEEETEMPVGPTESAYAANGYDEGACSLVRDSDPRSGLIGLILLVFAALQLVCRRLGPR